MVTHRRKVAFWTSLVFMISSVLCKINNKFLLTQPCDIHEYTNTSTVTFNCHRRGLTKFPWLFKNTSGLDLSENKVRNLNSSSLRDLQALTELNLNWMNQKQEVKISPGIFTNLTNLQSLKFSGVCMTRIPEGLPKSLISLTLAQNKIVTLGAKSFEGLENLKYLDLSKNCYYWNTCKKVFQINIRTFSKLDKLTFLDLSYNNLTVVPRGLPVSLTELQLASNSIQHIGRDDFAELRNLVSLKIQGNCPRCHNAPFPCTSCTNGSIDIHEHAFSNLNKLELLHMAGNSITTIKSAWFKNIPNLKELFLSYNFLMNSIQTGEFLIDLPLLTKLDISFNYEIKGYLDTVQLAPSFANLTSLRTLHMRALVFKTVTKSTLTPLYALQNLTTLDVGINFIVNANSEVFRPLKNLKVLYLAENRLYPITNNGLLTQSYGSNPNINLPNLLGSEPRKDGFYDMPKHLVKEECFNAGHVLDLSRNNIFFISPKQFDGYQNISCLNLSRNGFAAALNGTEFASLPHLKYLDLSFNKIDLAYDNAFHELTELEVLDLSYNPHYFTVRGVTNNLNFIGNLTFLRVLNMSFNSISTLTTKCMYSRSLNELQFQSNELGTMWRVKDHSYERLFLGLTNLTYLDISDNRLNKISSRIYKFLPVTLTKLRLSNNDLQSLNWTLMRNFTQLKSLILSRNRLVFVSENLRLDLPSLKYLDLSYNLISKLSDGFLIGAVNLHYLDLSHNRLATINQSTFPSQGPDSFTLWLHGNPFHCTCDLMDFILWIYNSDVNIPKLVTSLRCSMPEQIRGKEVMHFDIKECIDDQVAFLIYFCCTSLILCVTLIATLMHLFFWDVSYLFYYTKAKLKGYQKLHSGNNTYEAFVAYDTKDLQVSEWVLNHLRVQLEECGDYFLPVCLEERDWLPGCPFVDSLTQSIRQSRKTVFVLTHSYVNSGSFKMAMYLAHQRLLEDSEDVIVLLLLEPVLQNSHFLRLRRRLCDHSVLEWPRTAAAEPWFWQCLRNAIRVENKAVYNSIYSRYFTISKRT